MMENIRLAVPSDLLALADLWKACFGDTDDYPERFLGSFLTAPDSGVLLLEQDGAILGMACLVSVRHRKSLARGAYLYAVCTHPRHRGRGICASLLGRAKEMYTFLCLIPAKPSLFDFYRRFGFVCPMTAMRCPVADAPIASPPLECDIEADPAFDALIEESLLCAKQPENDEKNTADARKVYEICCNSRVYSVIMEERGLYTPHPALPDSMIAGPLPI